VQIGTLLGVITLVFTSMGVIPTKADVTKEVGAVEKQTDRLDTELQAVTTSVGKLEVKHAELNGKLEAMRAELNGKLDVLNGKLDVLLTDRTDRDGEP